MGNDFSIGTGLIFRNQVKAGECEIQYNYCATNAMHIKPYEGN